MTYPLSSDVVAGQPTAAAHYNNLRSDALRLGQAAADAAYLGDVLARYESGIHIDILSTDRLRIPATSAAPACLVIDGFPVRAVTNIDLPSGGKPSGGACGWYIFAVRSAGSTSFSLEVNTTSAESAGKRLIGQFYWDGTKIIKDSIRTSLTDFISANLYLANYQVCNGRLTVTSGSPIADGSTGTIYFTPFRGNLVSLYVVDYGWRTYAFSELSISVAGKAASLNMDVFIYDNAGTLTLELVNWSNATTRATALAVVDGILVKSGNAEKRYLGTLRTFDVGAVEDSNVFRGVWNYYNRTRRQLYKLDATASWTNAAATWIQWHNSASAKVEFVTGWPEDLTCLTFTGLLNAVGSGVYGSLGIGVDVVNANNAMVSTQGGNDTARQVVIATYEAIFAVGYHFLALMEYGHTSTVTFYGQPVNYNTYQSAAIGHVMA
jgi:hypothetical protein